MGVPPVRAVEAFALDQAPVLVVPAHQDLAMLFQAEQMLLPAHSLVVACYRATQYQEPSGRPLGSHDPQAAAYLPMLSI